MDLVKSIRTVPDFPKEGIEFFDITTVLQDPKAFNETIERMYDALKDVPCDVIVGLEARGFVFAAPLALKMGKSLSLIRKKGKLPYKTVEETYDLEYGTSTVQMHIDGVKKGDNVVLIDDLLATGGTINAGINLVKQLEGKVTACAFLIEILGLGGRDLLKNKCENIIALVEVEEKL